MLLPSLMNGNLFDNWMKEFPAGIANRENFFRNASAGEIMKTDVKETETGYDVEIDLPGFKKEEVTAKLDDGYLVISACRSKNSDEKDEEGKYIRRERYTGSCSRSFYVGDDIAEEDIKAKFEDGILRLTVPKKDPKEIKQEKYIAIEG